MVNHELVSKIAHLRHISSSFVDFRGQHSEVSIENIALIVKAMGYSLEDETELASQAWQLDTHQWKVLLEPITVLSELRGYWGVNLYTPDLDLGKIVDWTIELEEGGSISGTCALHAMHETGEYWLEGIRYMRRVLPMPGDLPLGYHSIKVSLGSTQMSSPIIVTPVKSFHSQPMAEGQKIWGSAIQLYTLKSDSNWGMGDFADLEELVRLMAAQGADVIGLNPIHALYPVSPDHCSPYSPSDRSFLNVLYTAIEQVPEFHESPALIRKRGTKKFNAIVQQLKASDQVQYEGVSVLKYEFFDVLFSVFKKKHLGKGTPRDQAFQSFLELQGQPLQNHATYCALLSHFKAKDINHWGWPVWPEAYQYHHSKAVADYAQKNEEEILYWCYLQFIADEQLQAIDKLAKELGMKIGLYRDLAVGADRGGAEVWSNRENFSLDASVGAPPDALGPTGQNWGLPPLDPSKLKSEGYQTFITLLRNNMRACGALRIDHAMALLRLWWCPPGETAAAGAYVYYDLFDMLGILTLESQRNQCMVIAEDLGTVPHEVLEFFPKAELYSNKVFYFEMNDQGCTEPHDYAQKALAIVCNHDMPTVTAFWDKSDLDLRLSLNMFGCEADYVNECHSRDRAKFLILDLLARHNMLPEGLSTDLAQVPEMTQSLCFAIHQLLATCNSQIIAVQLEDLMMIRTPINIPGTSDEYPNWRRRLTQTTSELFAAPEIQAFCEKLNLLRQK